ncbi:hypothetical protein [Streptomyces clavifer]|uniref:hypothetical protein n=1 Tax=Streptomyces clavifer TaxID=68188 RepID=UPI003686CF93
MAVLLFWWTAGPVTPDDFADEYEDPNWWWLHRLDRDHEGWAWLSRYSRLVETTSKAARTREPADPVSIRMPKEQSRLARAMVKLADEAGIEHSDWLQGGYSYRQLQVYFTGQRIPGNNLLHAFAMKCEERTRSRDFLETFERLVDLARAARAARARDRRVERGRLTAKT